MRLSLACVGLLITVAGCDDRIPLNDVWDAAEALPDAGTDARDAVATSDGGCNAQSFTATLSARSAEIMLVVDRSSGMQTALSGSSSKISAVQSALSEVIGAFQGRMRIGLEQFPSDATGKAGSCSKSGCCAGPPTVEPGYYANSGGAISSSLYCSNDSPSCASGGPDSPSHKALEQVRAWYFDRARGASYGNAQSQRSTFVLLITGSEPSCSSEPSGADLCTGAATAANDLGSEKDIPVIIVSVGYQPDTSSTNSCLVRLSKLGGKSPLPTGMVKLNPAMSASSLRDGLFGLFWTIEKQSCAFGTNDLSDLPANAQITVGSSTIAASDTDGWSFDGDDQSRIKLSGSACDNYLFAKNTPDVRAKYTCSTCSGPNACPSNGGYPYP
jgi:hypothetical protein